MRLVADLESDGLLDTITRVHCLVAYDLDSEEEFVFRQNEEENTIEFGLKLLEEAELTIWHNGISFDIPALQKLYPWFEPQGRIRDTLVCASLIFSDIKEKDFESFRKGVLPGKMIGRQGLEAWGYRLGEHKGDFGKSGEEDENVWEKWSQNMEDYCRQDVKVTVALWKLIESQNYPEDPIIFEHKFADLMALQERNGFPFNVEKAQELYTLLDNKRTELHDNLQTTFTPWWVKCGEETTPKKTITYKNPLQASRVEGAPYTPVVQKIFNPGSRDMIANRLQTLFGWKPKEFTETGKPKVSEDVLRDLVGELSAEEDGVEETEEELYKKFVLKIPQAKDLADYLLVAKRIGQLAEGKNGWLKLVKPDGRIHGHVNTLGTVSRRCSHTKPNVSQTPAVRSPWGKEMRSLWYAPDGWVLWGADLAAIELKCLAHFMAYYDNGEYANIVVNGDIHTHNQKAFGVESRDQSKTTLYALLYGAGDEKLGSIIGGNALAGKRIKQNFIKNVPAYAMVRRQIEREARRGWVEALDGGKLYVRSEHKALNTKLQSAAGIIAKQWAMQVEENLLDAGLNHGWEGDFVFVVHSHDEYQCCVRVPEVVVESYRDDYDYTEISAKDAEKLRYKRKHDWLVANSPTLDFISKQAQIAVRQTQEYYNFKCQLDAAYTFGKTWADTH